LSSRIGWDVQPSEGPPKYVGEMNDRLMRYAAMDNLIFDRHPVVSQSIYRTIRTGHDAAGMRDDLVKQFYNRPKIVIYCDPVQRGMNGHVYHEGVDSKEHLDQVAEGYNQMLVLYRAWAINHAHLLYRIGDVSMDFVAKAIMPFMPIITSGERVNVRPA
jgi:hypothetical protein